LKAEKSNYNTPTTMNRLRDLESALSSLDLSFPNPTLTLEQYPTSAHLASRVVFTAHSTFDDIQGKTILDLGCGTGVLSIAAKLMGAEHVVGIDIDENALQKAVQNAQEIFNDNDDDDDDEDHDDSLPLNNLPDFILQDVLTLNNNSINNKHKIFDVTIMNPPFGTKVKHLDAMFVRKAYSLSNVVYSLHKTSTREYFTSTLAKELDCKVIVVAELIFDIGKTYSMHKKDSKDIKVDLLRFSPVSSS
jgi:predicted RNA methylase